LLIHKGKKKKEFFFVRKREKERKKVAGGKENSQAANIHEEMNRLNFFSRTAQKKHETST
jgi:hypothetical protein